ncbi:MAG: hypothetical protein HYR83_00765 [Planctomycetes bacterium]|nr:hypothetical protein [Planctomycetota bacterium]
MITPKSGDVAIWLITDFNGILPSLAYSESARAMFEHSSKFGDAPRISRLRPIEQLEANRLFANFDGGFQMSLLGKELSDKLKCRNHWEPCIAGAVFPYIIQ